MTTRLRGVLTVVLALTVSLLPTSVVRAVSWEVDDTCQLTYTGTYFVITGPSTGWWIHNDPGSPGNCHLYTATTPNANPTHTAAYYLPANSTYNGSYRIWAFVNCEHNNALMKYWGYLNGSGGGVSYVDGTNVSNICDMAAGMVGSLWYNASMGAYVRLVDNTGTATTYQNADWLQYIP